MNRDSRLSKFKLPSDGNGINTIIGRGSVSEGTFRVETGVRVDGVLKGELVSSGRLIVGESGVIEATVKVRDALISGRIVGTLEAEEKVHLQAQSAFIGKIKTRLLVVEEGAVFKAECEAGEGLQVPEAQQPDTSTPVPSDVALPDEGRALP